MGTNGTLIAAKPRYEEEFRSQTTQARRQSPQTPQAPDPRLPEPADSGDADDDFVLAPLVDKIAFGIARGLVVAVKELEQHIASETRKVSDTVERQLDTLQVNLQELFRFVAEQRSANVAVQEQLQQLTVAGASLLETDARQAVELAALRTEAQESDARHSSELATFQNEAKSSWKSISDRVESLCGDVGVHQEDIGAVKSTLGAVNVRIDALVERLDRQAEAVRLMHTNYSQRETELEQLVNGLARLRAFPTPLPTNGL